MISHEQLQAIAQDISGQTLNEAAISQLRQHYPDIHFTYCMDDDIPTQAPMLECQGFNLYLVDGREHCLCLTRHYQHASGIVVAEVITD